MALVMLAAVGDLASKDHYLRVVNKNYLNAFEKKMKTIAMVVLTVGFLLIIASPYVDDENKDLINTITTITVAIGLVILTYYLLDKHISK